MLRMEWWKIRASEFPTLAPVAQAYLSFPRSSAQSERTFSFVGHIQTDDRLNMSNQVLGALTFIYVNKQLFCIEPRAEPAD